MGPGLLAAQALIKLQARVQSLLNRYGPGQRAGNDSCRRYRF